MSEAEMIEYLKKFDKEKLIECIEYFIDCDPDNEGLETLKVFIEQEQEQEQEGLIK